MGKQVSCIQCGYLTLVIFGFRPQTIQELLAEKELDMEVTYATRSNKENWRSHVFACSRAVLPSWTNIGEAELEMTRKCKWFRTFTPGCSSKLHMEMEREDKNRRFLWKVGLGSAAIGALVAWLLSMVIWNGPPVSGGIIPWPPPWGGV